MNVAREHVTPELQLLLISKMVLWLMLRRCYLSSQQLLDTLNGGLVGLVVACFVVSKGTR